MNTYDVVDPSTGLSNTVCAFGTAFRGELLHKVSKNARWRCGVQQKTLTNTKVDQRQRELPFWNLVSLFELQLLGIMKGVFAALCLLPAIVVSQQYCKPTPGTDGWPNEEAWAALNNSVSGRLVAVTPPGAVCHPDRPEYNNASCSTVSSQWTNTQVQAGNPVSADYNDETCLPNATAPCSNEGYPVYTIVAKNATDVQQGVLFANKTGIRLVIKGTGHDFLGR